MAVPWTTECRIIRPLERRFVDLWGNQPTPSGDAECLIMIVYNYSRLDWTCLLKRKSDVPNRRPRTTEYRFTRPLERLFVDMWGNQPTPAGDAGYLMMIVYDYSRLISRSGSPTSRTSSLVSWPASTSRVARPPWSAFARITALGSSNQSS